MKKSSKKEKFFRESLKLFHEKGYKATTMRDIAEKLNFEVANIYNYIDSKHSLLEIYVFEMSSEFHKNIDHIIDSSYSPLEKIKLVISVHIKLTSEKPYEMALLLNEWRNLNPDKLSQFLNERDNYESKFESILEQAMHDNSVRQMDLKIATKTILSSIRWLYDIYTNPDTTINPIELEKQITEFITIGIVSKSIL